VVRHGAPLGGVGATMVQQQALATVRARLRESGDTPVDVLGVQIRPRSDAALARGGRDGAIARAPRADRGHRADGRHPTRRSAWLKTRLGRVVAAGMACCRGPRQRVCTAAMASGGGV
jgi:hypothetical protein